MSDYLAERHRRARQARGGVPSVLPAVLPSVQRSFTSVAAAEALTFEVVEADERAVMRAITQAGHEGMTDDELEVATGLIHQTVSARRNGLVRKRRVRNSGRLRRTRRGRLAVVWIVGAGQPIEGAPNHRTPVRPDAVELRKAAAAFFSGLGDAEDRVAAWLVALAEDE